jgi:hypothetical protein
MLSMLASFAWMSMGDWSHVTFVAAAPFDDVYPSITLAFEPVAMIAVAYHRQTWGYPHSRDMRGHFDSGSFTAPSEGIGRGSLCYPEISGDLGLPDTLDAHFPEFFDLIAIVDRRARRTVLERN